MDNQRINKLLKQKEGIRLEFKEVSTNLLPKSLFESICAMLNGMGGDILLGVMDDGTVSGIKDEYIDQLIKDIVKNPLIAKFFIQLGRVDELGSGILNVFSFLKDYSPGRLPQFIEDKLFKTIIPVGEILNESVKVGEKVGERLTQNQYRIIEEMQYDNKITIVELAKRIGIAQKNVESNIKKLQQMNVVVRIGPAKGGHCSVNM